MGMLAVVVVIGLGAVYVGLMRPQRTAAASFEPAAEPGASGLIKCPDCGTGVSRMAPACVRCGRPMQARTILPSSGRVQAIEQTGKTWKSMQLLSGLAVFVGAVMFFAQQPSGPFVLLLGLCGFFLARFGAWWNHG
jgi:hypothetical protein